MPHEAAFALSDLLPDGQEKMEARVDSTPAMSLNTDIRMEL
jgi:hypothetical protein